MLGLAAEIVVTTLIPPAARHPGAGSVAACARPMSHCLRAVREFNPRLRMHSTAAAPDASDRVCAGDGQVGVCGRRLRPCGAALARRHLHAGPPLADGMSHFLLFPPPLAWIPLPARVSAFHFVLRFPPPPLTTCSLPRCHATLADSRPIMLRGDVPRHATLADSRPIILRGDVILLASRRRDCHVH